VALGLLRLIVGVGVRAAVSQRRRGAQGGQPHRPGGPPPVGVIPPSGVAMPPPPVFGPVRTTVSYGASIGVGILATICVGLGALAIVGQLIVSQQDQSPDVYWHMVEGIAGNLLVCVLPGVLLYAVTGWLVWRARRFARLQALCDTHARLPIGELAAHLGTSEEMAQALVLDAVERGLVRARLDLEPGIVLSGNAAQGAGRQWAGSCPRCNAPVSVVIAPGQPGICPYCRGALGVTG
jgi:hypothetical protein